MVPREIRKQIDQVDVCQSLVEEGGVKDKILVCTWAVSFTGSGNKKESPEDGGGDGCGEALHMRGLW